MFVILHFLLNMIKILRHRGFDNNNDDDDDDDDDKGFHQRTETPLVEKTL